MRLDLAPWIAARRNPLTARVTVNRLWQAFFGRGLVETENDFGTQGSPPVHPELLDWLAGEFIDGGWSVKSLIRRIVTSAVYRQSSMSRPDVAEVDPLNRLLSRQARIRLEAECVHDAALAASGLLTREIGGPGVYPPQPQGIYRFTQTAKYWKESEGADRMAQAPAASRAAPATSPRSSSPPGLRGHTLASLLEVKRLRLLGLIASWRGSSGRPRGSRRGGAEPILPRSPAGPARPRAATTWRQRGPREGPLAAEAGGSPRAGVQGSYWLRQGP